MSNQAVFVDRDRTLIEDPGYLAAPEAVKVLPGVELAIKSLRQAGYLVVVVTNQSVIARGILTEDGLEAIHAELRRQLAEKGTHLDAVYYCPYHPEGTVEGYAIESELRKPKPGMLLKGAEQLDIDLDQSWMVGDSPRDVEAGQRAGCRTVRIRIPGQEDQTVEGEEGAQADYTVRNLVEAARVILRAPAVAPPVRSGAEKAVDLREMAEQEAIEPEQSATVPPEQEAVAAGAAAEPVAPSKAGPDQAVRMEILRHVRQLSQSAVGGHEEFSVTKLIAGIIQVLALLALLLTAVTALHGGEGSTATAQLWALVAIVLQMMSLTFFIMQRSR